MQPIDELDRQLIRATQAGLPLVSRPYEAVGASLGISGELVRERMQSMLERGIIRRIGAVPNHYRLGFTANGMSVWDVDDDQVDTLGAAIGQLPFVSHCYRRPRHLPVWRFNLFAMLHGRSREEVMHQAGELEHLLGDACVAHDVLFSTEILKKTGLRLSGD
ncbi:MAG: AsnC family transcriptional regulator [Burkholderiaceae bacterium]